VYRANPAALSQIQSLQTQQQQQQPPLQAAINASSPAPSQSQAMLFSSLPTALSPSLGNPNLNTKNEMGMEAASVPLLPHTSSSHHSSSTSLSVVTAQ
jgi:hypothetical protein